jgi:PD-(D/E)XK nuclease superfamily
MSASPIPSGFPAGNLLEAKTISARISLLPLFRRSVEVETLSVNQPDIMVTPAENGHTNLEVFLKTASARAASGTRNKPAGAGNGSGGTSSTPSSQPKKEAALKINDLSVKSGTPAYSTRKLISPASASAFAASAGIPVVYENVRIDTEFRADPIVEDKVIVEIKPVEALAPLHKKKLLTYLRLADKRLACRSTSTWRRSRMESPASSTGWKRSLTQSR